jgi:hypothetical protein
VDNTVVIDPEELARIIGIPTPSWPNHCYRIAAAVVYSHACDGELVTGYYHLTDAVWDHAWVKRPDGSVYDPTLWCILGEGVPRIYAGPLLPGYDEEGVRWEKEVNKAFGALMHRSNDYGAMLTEFNTFVL